MRNLFLLFVNRTRGYNRFRYYSPDEGTYISQDPARTRGGFKLYSYVHDPNKYVDFLGLIELFEVPIDDHPLAEAVRKFRLENPQVSAGQNVAATKIEGIDDPIVRSSLNGRHSEHYLLEELDRLDAHNKIEHFYTELEPCSGIGMPNCKRKLQDALPENQRVTYSFTYPESDRTSESKRQRRKSVYAKKKACK